MANDYTPTTWAAAVLTKLGYPVTKGGVQALAGWAKAEGGHWNNQAHYNPLNTTQPEPGAGNTGSQGNIKVYKTWDQGIDATVQTLKNGRYSGILSGLRSGDAGAVASAIGNSPWGTSGGLVRQTINATSGSVPHLATPTAPAIAAPSAPTTIQPTTIQPTAPAFDPRAAVGAFLADGGVKSASAVQGLLAARMAAPANPMAAPAMASYGQQTRTQTPASSTSASASTMPSGTAHFEGKTVAAWIAPALQYARQHGWKGAVNNGYRSYADQQRIYNSGVRPAAKPGTSNHEGSDFPRGAVDVSDAQQLSQILQNSPYAGKLVWAGAKDPVHFSHPHNGSY